MLIQKTFSGCIYNVFDSKSPFNEFIHVNQFVCMRESVGGTYNAQNVYNMNPTEEHYEIVDWALGGGILGGIDNSLFFFNPYSSTCPTNFPTKVGVIHNRVGDHCFYIPTELYKDT